MIKWHVQHDDEVWAGSVSLGAAKDEQQAHEIVAFQNAAVERLKTAPDAGDLLRAFDNLTSWLLDSTETVFEEEPDIDEARSAIWEKIEELERKVA
ncbi:hypothetical protein [Pararhizobium qamdonense]|uniref:hypothetical protein n=1 Tax=Pararhizobium qamdonense TaxID=3031126 RepID=UPI0023E0B74F|nr:hypothetical protein [Pararhizobium qamdonense]